MHDLRKKIFLEGGKTVSKKARSRAESARGSANQSPTTSPSHSRPGSRANSRPGSRYASEEEDFESELDEYMTASTNSGASDDALDGLADSWAERLRNRIGQLEDRKRSSGMGRVDNLRGFLHLVRYHFARRQLDASSADIVASLLKSIKGGSAEERSLALKSLAVTTLTCTSESIFETVFPTLKTVCFNDEVEPVKVDAIYAMCITVLYGGGVTASVEDVMQFLLEIIESDGLVVNAQDSALVVIAAIQAWAFLASHLDDLTELGEEAMDAFVEQLDSTDADVQISAGSNIALLFEVARQYEKEIEEAKENEEDEETINAMKTLNLSYDPNKLARQLKELLKELSRTSKLVAKKDRKHIRANISSIVTSLELGYGPKFSTAARPRINPHTGSVDPNWKEEQNGMLGYREKISVGDTEIVIDSWGWMAKVETLRRVLGGGLPAHFTNNPTVTDIFE